MVYDLYATDSNYKIEVTAEDIPEQLIDGFIEDALYSLKEYKSERPYTLTVLEVE